MFYSYKLRVTLYIGLQILNRDALAINSVLCLFLSGLITLDEFQEACEVLNKHSKIKVSKDDIDTLGRTLDINKDGMIDFNEFLEAFRLVSLSFGDCSENSYHDLKSSVPSKESMRNSEGVSNKV